MDGGDLYGGLELPKKTKREREEEGVASNKEVVDSTTIDAVVKRQRVETKPLDLPATVAKLEGYMVRVY